MNKLILLALVAAASPAFATDDTLTFPSVPEIDALAGAAALAVVGGVVALVRDRSKR